MGIDRRAWIAAAGAAAAGSMATRLGAQPEETATDAKPGKTQFAVNIEMWWRGLSFLDRIRAAHRAGFPAVEFWPWRGKPIDETRALIDELEIDVAQFTAWGFVPGLNEPAQHENFEKAIEDGCQTAKKLRCKKMTVVGGNDIQGKSPAEMHSAISS